MHVVTQLRNAVTCRAMDVFMQEMSSAHRPENPTPAGHACTLLAPYLPQNPAAKIALCVLADRQTPTALTPTSPSTLSGEPRGPGEPSKALDKALREREDTQEGASSRTVPSAAEQLCWTDALGLSLADAAIGGMRDEASTSGELTNKLLQGIGELLIRTRARAVDEVMLRALETGIPRYVHCVSASRTALRPLNPKS